MRCPFCGYEETKVIDTKEGEQKRDSSSAESAEEGNV